MMYWETRSTIPSTRREPLSIRLIIKIILNLPLSEIPGTGSCSCYLNKVVTEDHAPFSKCFQKSFDDFVDFIARQNLAWADVHIRLQVKLFPADQVDFIGRFEYFEDDLRTILKKIGIAPFEIPHRNATSHEHYSRYYTKRTPDIIARKYKADIETFGYQFESQ